MRNLKLAMLVAAAGLGFAGMGQASEGLYERATVLSNHLVGIGVVDRYNRAKTMYSHDNAHYVVGQPGAAYGVRLINRTSFPVLVVLATDGRNALTTQAAGFTQEGVVLGPHETVVVVDGDNNASPNTRQGPGMGLFGFASKHRPAKIGQWSQLGTIDVAVFKQRRWSHLPNADGFRKELTSQNFVRSRPYPDEILRVTYGTPDALAEKNVEMDLSPLLNQLPRL